MYITGKSSFSKVLCFSSNTSGVESFFRPLWWENNYESLNHSAQGLADQNLFSHPSNIWTIELPTSIPPITRNFLRLQTCGFSYLKGQVGLRIITVDVWLSIFNSLAKFDITNDWGLIQFQHDKLSGSAAKIDCHLIRFPGRWLMMPYFVSELHREIWFDGELSRIFLERRIEKDSPVVLLKCLLLALREAQSILLRKIWAGERWVAVYWVMQRLQLVVVHRSRDFLRNSIKLNELVKSPSQHWKASQVWHLKSSQPLKILNQLRECPDRINGIRVNVFVFLGSLVLDFESSELISHFFVSVHHEKFCDFVLLVECLSSKLSNNQVGRAEPVDPEKQQIWQRD